LGTFIFSGATPLAQIAKALNEGLRKETGLPANGGVAFVIYFFSEYQISLL